MRLRRGVLLGPIDHINRPQRLSANRRGFGDFEAVAGLEVALATKPVFHGELQMLEGNAVADLENAITGGEG